MVVRRVPSRLGGYQAIEGSWSGAPLDDLESRRICYVHVGTHKTGTTSVQRAFAANDRAFADAGMYFPRRGRPDPAGGHHNIAWQLNDDRRFDPAFGTFSELLGELAAVRPLRALISSEDFEYLHARSERLQLLTSGLGAIGYRPVAIVYLRPQAGYAESLYAELVKYGLAQGFDAYLGGILESGEVRFNECWRFAFDYERLLDGIAGAFGRANVIARSYDIGTRDIVEDFCRAIGADEPLHSGRVVSPGRLNAASSFAAVVQRFELNVALQAGANAPEARPLHVAGRFDPVQLPQVRQIVECFNTRNTRVYERYGALVPCVSGRDVLADLTIAAGLNPAGRQRRRLLEARSRHRAAAEHSRPAPAVDMRAAVLSVAAAARSEVVVVFTAAATTLVLLLLGWQNARTAFVEFGLLSFLFALTVAGRVARAAADANGMILDRRFLDTLGARLRAGGYTLLGAYAVVNALLDVGVRRWEHDVLSLPGALATATAALVVIAVLAGRRRARVALREGQAYIALGAVVLALEAAHAAAPVWWLDTTLDMVVFAFAGARLGQIVRNSRAVRSFDDIDWRRPLRARSARVTDS
jgi:hypothetical protein